MLTLVLAIVVNQQSLFQHGSPASEVVTRQIASLASENHLRRREARAFLASLINDPDARNHAILQINTSLPQVLQLTLVASDDVRNEAIEVLKLLPRREIEERVEGMLPYVRSGLTHLAANVASTSLDILKWLIDSYGEQLVSCRGGWTKMLKCFLVMLRWTSETRTSGWTFSRSSIEDATYQGTNLVKCLEALAAFLKAGLSRPREDRVLLSELPYFPIAGTLGAHLPTSATGGYSCLDLFGGPLDNENAECSDVDARKQAIADAFQPALEQGLAALLRDGGDVGPAAADAAEILRRGMADAWI